MLEKSLTKLEKNKLKKEKEIDISNKDYQKVIDFLANKQWKESLEQVNFFTWTDFCYYLEKDYRLTAEDKLKILLQLIRIEKR